MEKEMKKEEELTLGQLMEKLALDRKERLEKEERDRRERSEKEERDRLDRKEREDRSELQMTNFLARAQKHE